MIGAVIDLMKAPLYEDLYLGTQLMVRATNQEFREAQEDFFLWAMRKPILQKFRVFFQSFIEGALRSPTGEIQESMTKMEALKRLLVGNWTEQGVKENELNEMLSKLLPMENYTKWDQNLGSRLIKTDYQKNKEDIMRYIKNKGYRSIKEVNGDKVLVDRINRYNEQVKEKLKEFFRERDKLTGEITFEKEWESYVKRVTVQEDDIQRWFETEEELRTIPSILRRTR